MSRFLPKPLRAGFAWVALLLLLVSCGNDPHPKPFRTKREDGTPWVVRYMTLPDDIRSLDPQVSYDSISWALLDSIQDNLLAYHPMKSDPYEVRPQMLAAMPERITHEDGSVSYLCRLQRGLHYHDDPCFPGGKGREVVAADVHYSLQRICDPALESPFQGTLADYVVGMSDAFAEAKKVGHFDFDRMPVAGFEAVDRYTFRLRLSRPYPQMLYWLTTPPLSPVPREAVEYYDGAEHPDGPGGRMAVRPLWKFHLVGTGPFYIHDQVAGQRYRLVRVPGYHTEVFPTGGWPAESEALCRPLAGHALPLVDEVQIIVLRELLPGWIMGRQGYLDRIAVQKAAAAAAITSSSELAPVYANRGMKLARALTVSTFFQSINMQDPLLGSNLKLRQALSCAYDPRGFVDMLYGGVAPIAQQLLPPGIFGYQKDFRNPYGFDLEKGRRLMAEAGYPDGRDPRTGEPLEITMDVAATGGEERQLYEYEQSQFQQLGIRMRIIENTFARLQEKADQGNFQILSGSGWNADYPDAENFFAIFTEASFPPQGKNECRYRNAEFEKLFRQMASMEDSPERLELIRRMNDILIEDCPIILNFNKAFNVIVQPWAPLTHLNMMIPGDIYAGLRYLPIDPVAREKARREWNPVPKWPLAAMAALIGAGAVAAVRINRRRVV